MGTVALLEHAYRDPQTGADQRRFIGIFSDRARALDALERLKLLPGFRDFPDDFVVADVQLDYVNWRDGFTLETNGYPRCAT